MISLLLFLFGSVVGSFLLVLIDRIPRGEAFYKGRSHCESCKHILAWYDLIPLISYILLNGKCRYCKTPYGVQYPLFEVATGLLFTVTFWLLQGDPQYQILYIQYQIELLFYLFIISCLFVVFVIDLKYGIIPFSIVFPAIFTTLLYYIFTVQFEVVRYIFSAIGSFAFFFFLFAITKGRGMGFGDVVFAFFMGLLLGFPTVVAAHYIAFLTGAILSLILILWRKKRLHGSTIPFGPFLVFGTYVALFWGDALTRMFFNITGI